MTEQPPNEHPENHEQQDAVKASFDHFAGTYDAYEADGPADQNWRSPSTIPSLRCSPEDWLVLDLAAHFKNNCFMRPQT